MKNLVITGASRGIGRFLSDQLSSDYRVIGIARTRPSEFEHDFVTADVRKPREIALGLKEMKVKQVYGLINCAGIASMNLFLTTPQRTFSEIFEVNTVGTMNVCSIVLPLMIRNGDGRVINLSSIAARIGLEGEAIYAASKAAVETFSRVLAKEMAPYRITVNTISPNPVDTDLIKGVGEERIQRLVDTYQAIKRKGTPEDVINVVRFYLSDESRFITGQNLTLGGY